MDFKIGVFVAAAFLTLAGCGSEPGQVASRGATSGGPDPVDAPARTVHSDLPRVESPEGMSRQVDDKLLEVVSSGELRSGAKWTLYLAVVPAGPSDPAQLCQVVTLAGAHLAVPTKKDGPLELGGSNSAQGCHALDANGSSLLFQPRPKTAILTTVATMAPAKSSIEIAHSDDGSRTTQKMPYEMLQFEDSTVWASVTEVATLSAKDEVTTRRGRS